MVRPTFTRFSVLGLLLFVAVCAVVCSMAARWAVPRWKERQAAERVYALGGDVFMWTRDGGSQGASQAELPYWPRIAGVDNWSTHVTAAHIEPLLELPKLRSLTLWSCTLEPRALERLGECDSRLINLILRDCSGCDQAFEGAGPISVCRVAFVRGDLSAVGLLRLHLPDAFWFDAELQLDDAALTAIRANCPRLERLDVGGSLITDAGCQEIGQMAKLETLWLTGSPAVTNLGWQVLARSQSLKEACLYGTNVSLNQATADGQWQEGYGQFTLERVAGGKGLGE